MDKYLLHGKESERLIFRKVQQSDFEEWLPFFQDPHTHLHWNVTVRDPEKECHNWIDKQLHRYENDLGGMNALIGKSSGRLVGFCGLLVQTVDDQTELEIGYSLLPSFWGHGYAIEAARCCKDYAFRSSFSSHIISIISLPNVPSQQVAKKNGMQIWKQTVYKGVDVYIFRISKAEWLN
ncbi:MAG: GNAT family N-acetyltransferase [Cyclobacteriaceae bacterium]